MNYAYNNTNGFILQDYQGVILDNEVSHSSIDGISFLGSGSGDMTTVRINDGKPLRVNNSVNNNAGYGVPVGEGSFPILGFDKIDGDRVTGGFNEFFGDGGTYSVINHNPKELIGAQINWWSGSYAGPLLTNPQVGDIFNLKKGSSSEDDSLFKIYNQATDLYRDSLWIDAINIYSQVLMAAPDDSLGLRSLVSIAACHGYLEDDDEYLSFVDGISSDYDGTLVGEVASDFAVTYLAQHNELDVALGANTEVLDEYPGIPNTNEG